MTITTWTRVCALATLDLDRGVAVLLDGETVAIFRVSPDGDLFAVGNVDPFSGASVLSRGIVGSKGDIVTIASPVYKQRFDLRTGRCLDDESVAIVTYEVRAINGWIEVGA